MLEIIHCDQSSEEWYRARLGIPTASEFSTVMASGRDGGESKTRRTYMLKLAGEILTEAPMSNYSNGHMERGKDQEHDARETYCQHMLCAVERVGFIRNGNKGCSPDGLIGRDGGLEIKSAEAHIQIERLLLNRVPPEHVGQVQGNLWIGEREWWDFVSFCPKLPPLIIRSYRDEAYIAKLAAAVDQFNDELAELVDRIRAYGGSEILDRQLSQSLEAA